MLITAFASMHVWKYYILLFCNSLSTHFFFKELLTFLFIYLFIYLAVLGLRFWQAGATLHRGARASHYRGLSCCGAQAPDAQAQ